MSILGELTAQNQFPLEEAQRNAWLRELDILHSTLNDIDGFVLLEYSIPRMGRRVDAILLLPSCVVVIEFKIGASDYSYSDIDQVTDYALDLKNFHEYSHDKLIVPILVATEAPLRALHLTVCADGVYETLLANRSSLRGILNRILQIQGSLAIDFPMWIESGYRPTPTIIEAAQALYQGHRVHEISRSDAGAYNLTRTTDQVTRIIDWSKRNSAKSICFVTGVPGAGKTLAGLNIANSWHDPARAEHAVFLSGNGPLVEVLREALARNEVQRLRETGQRRTKSAAMSKINAFIQNVHHFRDEGLTSKAAPVEHVVIFDEAQRAWDSKQTAKFMKNKKGVPEFNQSEPEFLVSVMDRHSDWATIVCLIGQGQEINTGEAGLQEWFGALQKSFRHWNVYLSEHLREDLELREVFVDLEREVRVTGLSDLHLNASVRSFRSEQVSELVGAILDCDVGCARSTLAKVLTNYPIILTRNIDRAKAWLRERARGSERHGIVASSEGLRLKPLGINVKEDIDPKNWFLNDRRDVRSSYYLEDVATEFQIQGLELDWICVAWDADFRSEPNGWGYYSFRGTNWQSIRDSKRRKYMKNAYRVLLTRARQGMVIFIPRGGDIVDHTRPAEFYDHTYQYLRSMGIQELT